jgi:hypothetical protein
MKLPRRKFLHLAVGVAALPAVSLSARAQTYPSRPVRLVVGFPPGGGADIFARLMGQWLLERLGQPFVIENHRGSGKQGCSLDSHNNRLRNALFRTLCSSVSRTGSTLC